MKISKVVVGLLFLGGFYGFANEGNHGHDHDKPASGTGISLAEQLGYAIAPVEIRSIGGDSVIALPIDSVYQSGNKTFVIAENMKNPKFFDRWEVKLGVSDGKHVEAVEGVLPGDRIVVQIRKLSPINPELLKASRSSALTRREPPTNPIPSPRVPGYTYQNPAPSKPPTALNSSQSHRFPRATQPGGGSSKLYGIQVGAFSDEANAKRVASRLQTQYKRADILQSVSNGRSIFRVRVGEFNSPSVAKATSSKLEKSGFPQAFVVPF